MNRTARKMVVTALCLILALSMAACTAPTPAANTGSPAPAAIRIGALPTEDSLPLWVAERDGLFAKAGLTVTITVFQSAQERDAALTAGAIDGFMGDIIAASLLRDGGVPVKITTVMLGATAKEGRFGIVVKPGSTVKDLRGLAGVPIGTSTATIQEYILDKLMEAGGVAPADVKTEPTPKVPVRYELLMSGKLAAAALPEPFLSLAQVSGAKILADDTTGANISQTVLIFSEKYLKDAAGSAAVQKLLGVWNEGATLVNKDPNSFRSLLVDKARLPEPLKSTYAVNTYPMAQLPTENAVGSVVAWMKTKSLLKGEIGYGDLTWSGPAK